MQWAPLLGSPQRGVGCTICLELGQLGASFETVKVCNRSLFTRSICR